MMDVSYTLFTLMFLYSVVVCIHIIYFTFTCIMKKEIDLDHIIVDSVCFPVWFALDGFDYLKDGWAR